MGSFFERTIFYYEENITKKSYAMHFLMNNILTNRIIRYTDSYESSYIVLEMFHSSDSLSQHVHCNHILTGRSVPRLKIVENATYFLSPRLINFIFVFKGNILLVFLWHI